MFTTNGGKFTEPGYTGYTERTTKAWFQHSAGTSLYRMYDTTIDDSCFNLNQSTSQVSQGEISENITIEESFTAQQQMLWNEEKYLRIAPGEANVLRSLLFDEYAEELSFPSIYLAHFRNFREGVRVTPFRIATSELRRVYRRGLIPPHLL
ncbi:ATP-dependent DNA helicase [Trichonephila clavipes]|uniref:ATP-dependent DNA helicase n=1 Tax=Trichonephila clavipes TaxID=2585209 RepID=A0A8X6SGY5_TRICX|nr:ATP-dependent DNA helicase [Trichonephila clavipes]